MTLNPRIFLWEVFNIMITMTIMTMTTVRWRKSQWRSLDLKKQRMSINKINPQNIIIATNVVLEQSLLNLALVILNQSTFIQPHDIHQKLFLFNVLRQSLRSILFYLDIIYRL